NPRSRRHEESRSGVRMNRRRARNDTARGVLRQPAKLTADETRGSHFTSIKVYTWLPLAALRLSTAPACSRFLFARPWSDDSQNYRAGRLVSGRFAERQSGWSLGRKMYLDFTGRMAPRYGMPEIVPIPEERARPSISAARQARPGIWTLDWRQNLRK